MRLFCFPFAGGGPSVFREWQLPAELAVEVCAVHLPGRESRWDEPPPRRIRPLLLSLADQIGPLLDRPFAFFGHSMGALLAYELTRLLGARGRLRPRQLFLSAHRAPERPAKRGPVSTLPDDEFLARLLEMAGSSRSAMRHPDLLLLTARTTRSDFELCEKYRYRPTEPLDIPLSCFAADDDSEVDVPDVAAWSQHTTRGCGVRTFRGGHLFLLDHAGELQAEIAADLVLAQERRGKR
jgi:medium-chain acyl-[acyl-carrier-protein] hydrolase